ncbi:MAG: hypothetical protein ACLQLG_10420 [Thermoguttaceae bacterium]
MFSRLRSRFPQVVAVCLLSLAAGTLRAQTPDKAAPKLAAPITKGQRMAFASHSFHVFVPDILKEMVEAAGIKGHVRVAQSSIGGSKVVQHWDVPDKDNRVKDALRTGKVDVLSVSPVHLPDDGIEKFTALALKYNPDIRVLVQEFWLRWDIYEPTTKIPARVDHNAITGAELRKRHAPYFQGMDDLVRALNKKFGKQVIFVVPAGQAVLALREKIIAGQAPGLKKQSDVFVDDLGHGNQVIEVLVSYCHFAVTYRRSPVGLPVPSKLATWGHSPEIRAKLNRLLQEIAWEAAIQHPLSGLQADARP